MPATHGARSEEGRPQVPPLPVTKKEPALPPALRVARAEQAPKLDGDLSDPVWSSADETGSFVDPQSGREAELSANARMLWDEHYLYVGAEVLDRSLRARHRRRDDPLCERDCFALLLDPDGDGRHYFEIQVSPRGVLLDTRHESTTEPRPLGHLDWSSEAQAAVSVDGRLDDDAEDLGYGLELAIPWHALVSADGRVGRAPSAGERWRANLYVVDRRAGGQLAAAWSAPHAAHFYVPQRFGSLHFEAASRVTKARRGPLTISPERAQQLPRSDLDTRQKLDRAAIRQFRGLPGASPVEPKRTKLESGQSPH